MLDMSLNIRAIRSVGVTVFVLCEQIRVLRVVESGEAYGQIAPFIIGFVFSTVCDHEVLDMEAGALNAFIKHH